MAGTEHGRHRRSEKLRARIPRMIQAAIRDFRGGEEEEEPALILARLTSDDKPQITGAKVRVVLPASGRMLPLNHANVPWRGF